jgi:RNA polymerase sigma-70 factor (ECF subfamily)
MGICFSTEPNIYKTEPNIQEDSNPSSSTEHGLLENNSVDQVLNLSWDRAVSGRKEWVIEQQKLSSDLRENILALFDEYRPRLFRYMRSMNLGRDQAEDVIQETFMRLATELLKRDDIENVQGWIVRVAHNLAADLLRKERGPVIAAESASFVMENRADPGLSPEEAYSKKEQSRRMKIVLSTLKPQHRQCFQMRTQGFRYKDIGLALGISEQRAAFVVKEVAVRLAVIFR